MRRYLWQNDLEVPMKFSYLFVIALLSQGCLMKKMAVNHADIGIEGQIEKRMPLYSAQKDQLSLDVDKFLNTTKPEIKSALVQIKALTLDASKVESQYQGLRASYMEISEDYLKLLSRYMSQLDDKQQRGFWEKFDKTTADFKKRTESEQKARLEDRYEMFFGTVNPAQMKLLHAFGEEQIAAGPAKAKLRDDLRQKMMIIFTEAVSPEAKAEAFTVAYHNYQEGLMNDARNITFLKSLMGTLSQKQRTHFNEKVIEIEELVTYFLTKDF